MTIEEQPPSITFQIVEGSSVRGQNKLFDSRGYSYCIKRRRPNATDWQCSIRGKLNRCPGSVIQRSGSFHLGNDHNHVGNVGLPVAARVKTAIKRKAEDDIFRPASSIVNEVLLSKLPSNTACPSLPQVDHLIRAANRLRQSKRPQDPKDLEFILQEGHLPANFLQAGVKMRSRRHLIFATAEQLKILSKAKQWYVDGTVVCGWNTALHHQCIYPPRRICQTGATCLCPHVWPEKEGLQAGPQRDLEPYAFYMVVQLLYNEATLTNLCIRLVSDKKLRRIQRKKLPPVSRTPLQFMGGIQSRRKVS